MPTEWDRSDALVSPEEQGENAFWFFNQKMIGVWCLLVLVCLFFVWNAGLKTEKGLKTQEAGFLTMAFLSSKIRLAFPALSGKRTGESLMFGQNRLFALLKREGLRVHRGRGEWKVRRPGYPTVRIQWKLVGGRAQALLEAPDVEGLRPLAMGL